MWKWILDLGEVCSRSLRGFARTFRAIGTHPSIRKLFSGRSFQKNNQGMEYCRPQLACATHVQHVQRTGLQSRGFRLSAVITYSPHLSSSSMGSESLFKKSSIMGFNMSRLGCWTIMSSTQSKKKIQDHLLQHYFSRAEGWSP